MVKLPMTSHDPITINPEVIKAWGNIRTTLFIKSATNFMTALVGGVAFPLVFWLPPLLSSLLFLLGYRAVSATKSQDIYFENYIHSNVLSVVCWQDRKIALPDIGRHIRSINKFTLAMGFGAGLGICSTLPPDFSAKKIILMEAGCLGATIIAAESTRREVRGVKNIIFSHSNRLPSP